MTDPLLSALAAGTMAIAGGGSGLLSVPSASLMAPGTMEYQHTNGLLSAGADSEFGRLARLSGDSSTDHFQFSVVPRLEFGGRLTTIYNQDTGRRDLNDLSGHLKFQLFQNERFRLAAGVRDLAGEVRFLSPAKFVVADWTPKYLSLTLGYGRADAAETALDGVFGGVAVQPSHWLKLMADYDGVASHVGFQLHGQLAGFGLYLKGEHNTNAYREFTYAAGLQTYLGVRPALNRASESFWHGLAWRQQDLPFDSMLNTWAADELRVQSPACDAAASAAVHAYNIPVLRYDCDNGQFTWLSDYQQSGRPYNGHLEARIHPVVGYSFGTEFGRLDYSIALRGSLQWHLPAGLSVIGVWDANAINSDDYKNDGQFSGARLQSGLVEALAQYTTHYWPGSFAQLSAGRTALSGEMVNVQRAELASHFFAGSLALDYSYTRFAESGGQPARHQRLGKVFYWLQKRRYAMELTRGDFLFGDTGYRAEFFAYLNRTRLGLYYKRGLGGFDFEAVGLNFNFALSPRHSLGNRWVSLKALPQFQVPLETQINDEAGNFLRPSFLNEYVPQRQLVRDVLDRWRLSPGYVGP